LSRIATVRASTPKRERLPKKRLNCLYLSLLSTNFSLSHKFHILDLNNINNTMDEFMVPENVEELWQEESQLPLKVSELIDYSEESPQDISEATERK
jgi:hypothetical protein